MDIETFQALPTEELAQWVRSAGSQVCVFPINGTRRWFVLEHPAVAEGDSLAVYLDTTSRRHIELYQMLFDHGLDTLLTPVFGPDLMERGADYMALAAEGLARLATHPQFLDFYREHRVRVRFYGDHRKYLTGTPYGYLSDLFDEIAERTAENGPSRLFFGTFAHDAIETIAELAVRYHAEQGRVPDKRALVKLYYGEYVDPVDLFIGFDKLCVFDMPLVATGSEDLYFTISPSLYLTRAQLRAILYDHLVTRRQPETDYAALEAADWAAMRNYYRANLGRTLGIGVASQRNGVWYPLPQVALSGSVAEALS